MIKLILKCITRLKQRYQRYKNKQHLKDSCHECFNYEICKAMSETHLLPEVGQELTRCKFYTPKVPR